MGFVLDRELIRDFKKNFNDPAVIPTLVQGVRDGNFLISIDLCGVYIAGYFTRWRIIDDLVHVTNADPIFVLDEYDVSHKPFLILFETPRMYHKELGEDEFAEMEETLTAIQFALNTSTEL